MSNHNIPQSSRLVKTSPQEIYLNVFESADDCTCPFPNGVCEEITWSEQACLAGSVRYVRADLAARLEAGNAELVEALRNARQQLDVINDTVTDVSDALDAVDAVLAKHGAAK